MRNGWKITAITFIIFTFSILGIGWYMTDDWKDTSAEWAKLEKERKEVVKSQEQKIDSLKSYLSQYGWKSDMMFMCVGIVGDSADYPTVKIYDSQEKEIGKFIFIWKESDKIPHLGDKFSLVFAPGK